MKKNLFTLIKPFSLILSLAATSTFVYAEGRLTVYCSSPNETCEVITKAFADKYNVNTSFIRNSAGSTLAKIHAEAKNPRADVWYGGTLEPHSQAAEMGLLQAYQSPLLEEINPKFKDPGNKKGNYSSAIYLGILGFGVNKNLLAEKNIDMPLCWKDLLKPEFKDLIQIPDPQSSGTAYTALATFNQLWPEEEAFEYLKALNNNISQYSKSGVTPSRNTARGEALVGISFLHDHAVEIANGAPVEIVAPCEGTGYEIGGVSIIEGARNLDNAQKFVDYVLSKEAQELTWRSGSTHTILTNINAEQSPNALDFDAVNLIDYDMTVFGSGDKRKYLIDKWLVDVKMNKKE